LFSELLIIGDNDTGFDLSESVDPFSLRIFISGSDGFDVNSVSESLRFAFVGIDSIIYKLELFFVALLISLHFEKKKRSFKIH